MKVSDILNSNYVLLTDDQEIEFQGIYATDLLSAAIKSAEPGNMLITIISHDNTIGCAIMIDLTAVLITENRTVSKSMINKANESKIAIIQTVFKTHEAILDLKERGCI
jgi:predicted transcriptional regulator